jgi:cytoskeleton-associated protein 5
MVKAKSPKTQADALVWVNSVLLEFGVAGIPLRDLIEFLKTNLKSSNAAVRANATKALVSLRLFVGTGRSSLLSCSLSLSFDEPCG